MGGYLDNASIMQQHGMIERDDGPLPPTPNLDKSQYMVSVDIGDPAGKTRRVEVRSRRKGDLLGVVSWFGRWRQYAFHPAVGTTFNSSCLRDLMDFLHELMESRHFARMKEAGQLRGARRRAKP